LLTPPVPDELQTAGAIGAVLHPRESINRDRGSDVFWKGRAALVR
jgi:hypothetical protein